MAKVIGFDKAYSGLKDNEAWQKIYEFGKNLMPIKEHILQKKYNKIFNKNTKVIRENILKKISTDKLVPGDIIIIEKGDFVPVDGKILEEVSLEFDEDFKVELEEFSNDINDKIIYQGMKVKKGKAIIEAIRTSDNTYLGTLVKKIDNKTVCETSGKKALLKYFSIIGGLGLIFLLFGSIFSFITNKTNLLDRLSIAGYSGLLMFLATAPVGALLVFYLRLIDQKDIMKKSNLIIKKYHALLNAHKTTVICLDERFLSRNYEKYIQRFYSAGIMISVISSKNQEEITNIAKDAGIFEEEVKSLSGKEIENMIDDEFYQAICDTIIFYDVNRKQKQKILEGFYKLNIKVIGIIDDIGDLPTLNYANVSICTHDRKRNLEYEFSNANINGTDLTSIYSLIKGSCMMKNYLNHYIKYYIMFQTPIILSLLVALLSGLDLKVFYLQTLIFIMVIIPLLLLLLNRDYSEEKIFELKNRDKKFGFSCIKFGFIGFLIGVLGIGFYILLSYFNLIDTLKISCVTVLFTLINSAIIILSRKIFRVNKKAPIKTSEITREETFEETKVADVEVKKKLDKEIKKKTEKAIKKKQIKFNKKDDIKDEII